MSKQAIAATTPRQQKNIMAIVVMFFLFAMISFVTNLAAPLGTIWKNSYSWAGMMGNMMNFMAYLFMGIPAGNLLLRIGYKKTALWAMAIGFIGLTVQYSSSLFGADVTLFNVGDDALRLNFVIYLLGAFISGFCVCMLNTVVNPLLNILGGGGTKGNQLLQAGGSCNSLSGTLTPLVVGMLIGNVTDKTSLTDVAPLLWIAMGVFAVSFLVTLAVRIPEPNISDKKVKYSHSPWNFRHTVLGVISIFFYVGLEVGIPGVLIFYLSDSAVSGITENATAVAGAVAAMYWLLMLVGRLSSSVISGKVSGRNQLIFASAIAILLVILAIFLPSAIRVSIPAYSTADGFSMADVPVSALMLVLCGLCTSIMWGSIFNLSVEGLGKYTAQASGIFMMMVVGGGVMPLIQDYMADTMGYLNSYWLVVAMLAFILYFALLGSKNVNTDIPTQLEDDKDVPLNL